MIKFNSIEWLELLSIQVDMKRSCYYVSQQKLPELHDQTLLLCQKICITFLCLMLHNNDVITTYYIN